MTASATLVPNNTPQGVPLGLVDAKGDLIAGTGPDAVDRLPVAAGDWQGLVSRSTAATGLDWAGEVIKANFFDQTVSSTSFANSNQISFPVVGGAGYRIQGCIFAFSAATTTGMKLAVNAAVAATFLRFGMISQITQGAAGAASTFAANTAVAYDAATVLSASVLGTTAATPTFARLHGFYVPSGDTTLFLRIAGEAAASITYMTGSWMSLTRCA